MIKWQDRVLSYLGEGFINDNLTPKEDVKIIRRLKLLYKINPEDANKLLDRINSVRRSEGEKPFSRNLLKNNSVSAIKRMNSRKNESNFEDEYANEKDIEHKDYEIGDYVEFRASYFDNEIEGKATAIITALKEGRIELKIETPYDRNDRVVHIGYRDAKKFKLKVLRKAKNSKELGIIKQDNKFKVGDKAVYASEGVVIKKAAGDYCTIEYLYGPYKGNTEIVKTDKIMKKDSDKQKRKFEKGDKVYYINQNGVYAADATVVGYEGYDQYEIEFKGVGPTGVKKLVVQSRSIQKMGNTKKEDNSL